jgi:EAL domain-containing protein (putative c-di-GMP-specific phosphodiesterase class I)/CRP-like cAMP-binding protein
LSSLFSSERLMADRHRLRARPQERKAYRAGAYIFHEGAPGDCAYILESGRVAITTGQEGRDAVLCELGPGSLFGEMALIDRGLRSANAIALEASRLAVITLEQLESRIEAADPVLSVLMKVVVQRFRRELRRLRGPGTPATELSGGLEAGTDERDYRTAIDKMRLEGQLRDAMDARTLEVVFQPLLDLATGYWGGVEALMRWRHPSKGSVAPNQFIALAEETHLITELGLYVLSSALDGLLQFQDLWKNRGAALNPLFVGVNVSAKQLQDRSLHNRITEIVRSSGLEPQLLELEVTESIVSNYPQVAEWIDQCKRSGFSVAIDDFGTGYSSLLNLLGLNFDTVKIDQAFVKGMLTNQRAKSIVQGIIQLSKAMHVKIIAEGIETHHQLEMLQHLGCDFGQGYLIGKPQPATKIRQQILAGAVSLD